MFRFIQIFSIFRLLRKGREGRKELMKEFSFSAVEDIFFLSFFILGIFIASLFYLFYRNGNTFFLVFGIFLSLVVFFDIYLYFKIKSAFLKVIDKGIRFEEKLMSSFRRKNVIDVDVLDEE